VNVYCAAWKALHPSRGRVLRFPPRWSCATMVLRDGIVPRSIAVLCASLELLLAASWAALPAIVLFSGTPWRRIACVRNRQAAS